MSITIAKHFAIPIFYEGATPGFKEHRAGLLALINRIKANSTGVKRSNQHGWHSDYDLHRLNDPHINWLKEEIARAINAGRAGIGRASSGVRPVITELWANVNGAGGYNVAHNHEPHYWSGVIYIDAEATREGAVKGDKTGGLDLINPVAHGRMHGVPTSIFYRPVDGAMVIFPSFLLHVVHPHRSERPRISMAFNVDMKP